MWKVLLKSLREFKKPSILSAAYVAGEVAMECTIPFTTAQLVNEIKAGCGIDTIFRYGLMLLSLSLASLVLGRLSAKAAARAASGFSANLRKDMFYNIQNFSFENIDKFSTSSLVTRLTTDISYVQMAFMMIIRSAIRSPLVLIFSIIMATIMGGKLALIFTVTVPFLAGGLYLVFRKVHPIFRKVFLKYDVLNRSIQENIQGIRVVKSFVREDFEKEKFEKAADDVRKDFTRAERIIAFNSPVMQLCLNINMVIILTFGSYTMVSTNGLGFNVGQLSALSAYSFQTLMSLMMLSMAFVMITIAEESARRIAEVLHEKSSLTDPDDPIYQVKDGSIEFSKVSFRYSSKAQRMALNDINIKIRSGETIGILGGTGSAKTTLVQLIPRLYDATQGTVKVGGKDVRAYSVEALRNQVAVVLQNNVLFSGTIKENLRWGDPLASDERLKEVCSLAAADEFIEQFPQGYDTHIEQGGANVSGGQKQRLCIARALLKKPKILILDDSTSSVDMHTDARIRKAFKEYLPEVTKIIIAQRVASVQDADRIILMDKGSIAAFGTHEELYKNNAVYREVYHYQSKVGAIS